jgi:excisionase family DNA binding protein
MSRIPNLHSAFGMMSDAILNGDRDDILQLRPMLDLLEELLAEREQMADVDPATAPVPTPLPLPVVGPAIEAINVKEAARRMGISPSTFYKRNRKKPYRFVIETEGSELRINAQALEQYLDEHTRGKRSV